MGVCEGQVSGSRGCSRRVARCAANAPRHACMLRWQLCACAVQIVFRSGRDGHKNLYIMPTEGEAAGLIRLTEGPWDDTMPGWTPCSGWIVFASSRPYASQNRPAGAFDLWMVRALPEKGVTPPKLCLPVPAADSGVQRCWPLALPMQAW